MAISTETIRKITIQGQTQGVTEATDEVNKLSDAQKKLGDQATVTAQQTDTSSKRALSAADAYRRQTLALDEEARAHDRIARATLTANRAFEQGILGDKNSTEAKAALASRIDLINQKYGEASRAQEIYSEVTKGAAEVATEYAGELGFIGAGLASINPAMLAVVGTVGVLAYAYESAKEKANEFAQEMLAVRNASQAIGVTTGQFEALAEKGASFGVTEDKMASGLERFSVQMEQFRQRGGPLYELVSKIDDGLAQQMVRAHDAGTEINLLSQVYAVAGDRASALTKLALGRNAFDVGLTIADIGKMSGGFDGLVSHVEHAGDAIDKGLIERVTRLKTESDDMAKRASHNFESIYSERLLQSQRDFNEQWLQTSRVAKDFALSPSLAKFLDIIGGASRQAQNVSWIGPFLGAAMRSGIEDQSLPSAGAAGHGGSHGDAHGAAASGGFSDTFNAETAAINQETQSLGDLTKAMSGYRNSISQGLDVARQFDQASVSIDRLTKQIEDMQLALSRGGAGTADTINPAINAAQVQLRLEQDTRAETQRHNEAVLNLANSYQGVSLSTALILDHQRGQLQLADAVTGAERLAAQETERRHELLMAGKTDYEAIRISANERLIAEQKLTANARGQIISLEQQYNAITATTGAQKILVDGQNTFNDLVRQGVDVTTALQVASQQIANAQAQANTSVENQIYSLNQQTQLIYARLNGDEASVRAAQAYANALRQGADAAQAAALAAATMANATAQAAAAYRPPQQVGPIYDQGGASQPYIPIMDPSGKGIGMVSPQQAAKSILQLTIDEANREYNAEFLKKTGLRSEGSAPSGMTDPSLIDAAADKDADAWLKAHGMQPADGSGATDIQQSIDANTAAITANTDATAQNSLALSPYYSQGAGTHLGFTGASVPTDQFGNPIYGGVAAGAFDGSGNPVVPSPSIVPSQNTVSPAGVDTSSPSGPPDGFTLGSTSNPDYDAWQGDQRFGYAGFLVNKGKFPHRPIPGVDKDIAGPGAIVDLWNETGRDLAAQAGISAYQAGVRAFADGGVIPANSLALVGEHGPNPQFIRAGNEPIYVPPDRGGGGSSAPAGRPSVTLNAPVTIMIRGAADQNAARETAFQVQQALGRVLTMAQR